MSDHPSTVPDRVFEADMAVKMGDTIATSSQKVNVTRSATDTKGRQTTERGNIVIDVNHTLSEDAPYNAT